ncbi:transcription initiation factor IIA subunit 1 [Eurytemora carolleeae]|uniref:transcription initiation factor IIA subunit 1 n=1 Tax=Eurytemora carolleeae TaxID=1294199 RepID=UPI000C76C94D|nr:transcription initiation factor IIA subunit 1 [Eurytemora carolleeae]|eukprot:XP_023332623.1 transcription initiation factor IIA subunit 1-like [Eurytemora affinis]
MDKDQTASPGSATVNSLTDSHVKEDGNDHEDAAATDHDDMIVKEVIAGVTQSFLEEGVDISILKKLEALWITKIQAIDADATVAKSNPRQISQPVPRNIVKAKRNTKKSGKCENPVSEQALDDEVDLELTGAGLQLVLNPEKSKLTEPTSVETPGEGMVLRSRKKKNKKVSLSMDSIQEFSKYSLQPVVKLSKLKFKGIERKLLSMKMMQQVDGPADSSDDDEKDEEDNDEDEDDDDDDDDDDLDPDGEDDDEGAEEEPLGSEDDISDEDATEIFETDNVVVCQYDKISRTRNKWKFNLKDGIMNLNGKDYVFSRAHGEAEW